MAKDVLETEHRSPREYEPEVNPLETKSVPRLREVKEPGTSSKFAPTVFVDPESVVPASDPDPAKPRRFLLKPVFPSAPYKVHVFQHGLKGFVPTRIAAVVPGGLTEFKRALVFFHPLPTKRAGYAEGEYFEQTGGWHNIYRYCDQQGAQLAVSKRKFVLIFPIFNLGSTETCGRFPDEWKSLIEDIMVMVRNANAPGLAKQPRPALTDVVTASYSAGVKYMHTFLKTAKGLGAHLREVYDYDGRFSTHKEFSEKLIGIHPKAKVLIYDQQPVKEGDVEKEFKAGKGIHLPEPRWRDLPNGQTSFLNIAPDPNVQPVAGSLLVHGAMPRYMMFHSLSKSPFGH
ncbi:MAG: hypothetical protein U1E21_00935 [Reyranellaceae bacterium]